MRLGFDQYDLFSIAFTQGIPLGTTLGPEVLQSRSQTSQANAVQESGIAIFSVFIFRDRRIPCDRCTTKPSTQWLAQITPILGNRALNPF